MGGRRTSSLLRFLDERGTVDRCDAAELDALREQVRELRAVSPEAGRAVVSGREADARVAALLGLAGDLAAATDERAIAELLAAALPTVVGGERAAVLRWDPTAGLLRAVAAVGMSAVERAFLLAASFRPDGTPELAEMLARRTPTVIEIETASPSVRRVLTLVGVRWLIAVPVVAGDALVGVAAVGWRAGPPASGTRRAEVTSRLVGVADQAASALQITRLRDTVRRQALHDPLTGLPNRSSFVRHLDDVLRDHAVHGPVAVLCCDLDRFKLVNDRFGLAAGDELLRQAAARLSGTIRAQGFVARLGSDEFGLVVPGVPDTDAAEAVARRIASAFERPFRIEGCDLRITTSVGVALHTGPGGSGQRLHRAADEATTAAKGRGRNQVVSAGDTAPATRVGHRSLGDELRNALEDGQLRVRFQPILTVGPVARAIGNEALVRWQHPRLGLLTPAAFLSIAEEHGLTVDVDLWVLRAAAATAWPHGADADADPLYLAVNVSTETLLDDRLPAAIRDVLRDRRARAGQLVVELIESRPLVDLPGVVERLTELRHMGVRVSLDDFGTGYSTLTWLQQLPIDQIKIDRSFVAPLPGDRAATALVRGVVALCRELGIEVVAEGVETTEQLAALRAAGCQRVQGFLFGQPAPEPAGQAQSGQTPRNTTSTSSTVNPRR